MLTVTGSLNWLSTYCTAAMTSLVNPAGAEGTLASQVMLILNAVGDVGGVASVVVVGAGGGPLTGPGPVAVCPRLGIPGPGAYGPGDSTPVGAARPGSGAPLSSNDVYGEKLTNEPNGSVSPNHTYLFAIVIGYADASDACFRFSAVSPCHASSATVPRCKYCTIEVSIGLRRGSRS